MPTLPSIAFNALNRPEQAKMNAKIKGRKITSALINLKRMESEKQKLIVVKRQKKERDRAGI